MRTLSFLFAGLVLAVGFSGQALAALPEASSRPPIQTNFNLGPSQSMTDDQYPDGRNNYVPPKETLAPAISNAVDDFICLGANCICGPADTKKGVK
jgi:hypothetical protein